MEEVHLTWEEFVKESEEFLKISEELNDCWYWQEHCKGSGGGFLVYKKYIPYDTVHDVLTVKHANYDKLSSAEQADLYLSLEYNIVYSISYQVPVLYFVADRNDGRLPMEDIWKLFRSFHGAAQMKREDLLKTLSPGVHPIIDLPYFFLHPCRTAKVLAQAPTSKNRVLTFISMIGPYVHLQLDNRYGLSFAENVLTKYDVDGDDAENDDKAENDDNAENDDDDNNGA